MHHHTVGSINRPGLGGGRAREREGVKDGGAERGWVEGLGHDWWESGVLIGQEECAGRGWG